MTKLFWLLAAATLTAAALALPAAAATIGHDHFVSDPYADEWCGIPGTSVDRVVANYTEASEARASINVRTTFTTVTGKTMEIDATGVRKESTPVDNGDGTFTLTFTNAGQSPKFKLPNGPVIGLDVGLIQFDVVFDSATGDFVSFEVAKVAGQRLPLESAICAALS